MTPDAIIEALDRFDPGARAAAVSAVLRALAKTCPACGSETRTVTSAKVGEGSRRAYCECLDCGWRGPRVFSDRKP